MSALLDRVGGFPDLSSFIFTDGEEHHARLIYFRRYCDNATTSKAMMLTDKRCPAGLYCLEELSDLSQATNCSHGHYCPEGTYTCRAGYTNSSLCSRTQQQQNALIVVMLVSYPSYSLLNPSYSLLNPSYSLLNPSYSLLNPSYSLPLLNKSAAHGFTPSA